MVGPALGTALHRVGPIYPAALGGLLCLAAGFLQLHPAIRSAA